MNPSKQKGTKFETSLVPLVNEFWPGTIRNPSHGALDKGDLYMPMNTTYVIEAKNSTRLCLPRWAEEAQVEAGNAGVPYWVLVHKRYGKTAAEEQWATMTFGNWLALVHR